MLGVDELDKILQEKCTNTFRKGYVNIERIHLPQEIRRVEGPVRQSRSERGGCLDLQLPQNW
jgi:hypothetical protein